MSHATHRFDDGSIRMPQRLAELIGARHEDVGECYGLVRRVVAILKGVELPGSPDACLAATRAGKLPITEIAASEAAQAGDIFELDTSDDATPRRHVAVMVTDTHAMQSSPDAGVHLVPLRYVQSSRLVRRWRVQGGEA